MALLGGRERGGGGGRGGGRRSRRRRWRQWRRQGPRWGAGGGGGHWLGVVVVAWLSGGSLLARAWQQGGTPGRRREREGGEGQPVRVGVGFGVGQHVALFSRIPLRRECLHALDPHNTRTRPPAQAMSNILLLLALPPLYILLASVALLQFSVVFSALEAASVHAAHSAALEPVAPGKCLVNTHDWPLRKSARARARAPPIGRDARIARERNRNPPIVAVARSRPPSPNTTNHQSSATSCTTSRRASARPTNSRPTARRSSSRP